MPYGTARKELYHPTVEDVVTALHDLNHGEYSRTLFAYSVSDIGERVQRVQRIKEGVADPRYNTAWHKTVSQLILVRVIAEAVSARLIVPLEGRRSAALHGLAKTGMRERGSTYYITPEDFATAQANVEAKAEAEFKETVRTLATGEIVRRHKDEYGMLYAQAMDQYRQLMVVPDRSGPTKRVSFGPASARNQVLNGIKDVFARVKVPEGTV